MPTLNFNPSGRTLDVPEGANLLDACRRAGFSPRASCGGKGLCGKCRVRVIAGDVPVDGRQRACMPARDLEAGWRASCVAEIHSDLLLEDPDNAETAGVVLTDFHPRPPAGGENLWTVDLALPPPSTSDQRDDLSRLENGLAASGRSGLDIPLSLLAKLPGVLRGGDFSCRTLGLGKRLLDVRNASVPGCALGLAVDIGTTTMAGLLCDLTDGRTLAVASRGNPQARHGDDVISRVDFAGRSDGNRREMRDLTLRAIEGLADDAMRSAGLDAGEPVFVSICGNTVMSHLFLGTPATALALSPFIPAFNSARTFRAAEAGFSWGSAAVHLLPGISAYVGGDIVAGLLAHEVAGLSGNVLFIDVGTNGEIALASGGRLFACATAAGPAFEGARIGQGMRAAPGAIAKVGVLPDGSLDIGTIDMAPAKGICGTGLLDAVACLLKVGALDETGRLEGGDEYWLVRPPVSGGTGVALSQRDIREFQLAKGAIAAGVRVLLDVAGIGAGDVEAVLLAGGFGNYLDPVSALAVGLLPAGIRRECVRSVGNAALAGARLCLLSPAERDAADVLARKVDYVELSGRDDFQIAFAEEMLFPE